MKLPFSVSSYGRCCPPRRERAPVQDCRRLLVRPSASHLVLALLAANLLVEKMSELVQRCLPMSGTSSLYRPAKSTLNPLSLFSSFIIINVVISITAHFELFFDGLVERLQFCGASVWNDRKTGVALKGVFVLLSDDIHTILKTYYVDRDFLKILMLSDKCLGGHGALPNGQ